MPRRDGARKGNRGGRRAGAGRPKGRRNKAATLRQEKEAIKDFQNRFDLLPLQYMVNVMRDPTVEPARRDAMARAAAPFFHPRLSAVDVRSTQKPPRHSIDLRKLSDEQLLQLEQIVSVAGQVIDEAGNEQDDAPIGYLPVVSSK